MFELHTLSSTWWIFTGIAAKEGRGCQVACCFAGTCHTALLYHCMNMCHCLVQRSPGGAASRGRI